MGEAKLAAAMGDDLRRAIALIVDARPKLRPSPSTLPLAGAIYRAATRLVMRTLFARVAEARGLLPVAEHAGVARESPLEGGAWAELLARARLLHERGAALFAAGEGDSRDPSSRALAQLEDLADPLDDAQVEALLGLLSPSAGALDAETIGLAYQGLLDYDLRAGEGGAWSLRRWVGTRKGAGTFYTPAPLARATALRTLQPLTHEGPGSNEDRPRPRPPEAILAVRICDPAMGSGAFLLAALDQLTDALEASVAVHGAGATSGASTRAELRRLVAQRCIYGVDLDPLAVDLARACLWLELGDPRLRLDLVDHGLRRGNALVGCWRERAEHYPILAWEREGGDKNHRNFVHHRRELRRDDGTTLARGDKWTAAIKRRRAAVLAELAAALDASSASSLPAQLPAELMRERCDTWCALWFWPAESIELAPGVHELHAPSAASREIVAELREQLGFFHWELEFPEVFCGPRPGFDAILANPPWDTLQPLSREFFSRHDPRYRGYAKVRAVEVQTELFRESPALELAWIRHQHQLAASTNWFAHVAEPFCQARRGAAYPRLGRGPANAALHARWRARRAATDAGARPARPFRAQGRGKALTYKLFVELGHALAREGGELGLVVPSGLYSDRGTQALRELLLEGCAWRWLFGFDNAAGIFVDLERRFKFAVVVARKGGATRSLRAAFMRTRVEDWSEARPSALAYPRAVVRELSPRSGKLLELDSDRDLELMRKLHGAGVLVMDRASYRQGDLNMTSDAGLFWTAQRARAAGFVASEHGLWLAGAWTEGPSRPGAAAIREASGERVIAANAVDDVLCPLIQGSTIARYDAAALEPPYLVRWAEVRGRLSRPGSAGDLVELELALRDIARATDSRSLIGAPVHRAPCGNTLGKLRCASQAAALELTIAMNSLVLDWAARVRLGGTHLNLYVIEELAVPRASLSAAHELALGLAFVGLASASVWATRSERARAWTRHWALTRHERLRRVVILDALVAWAFALTPGEFRWILRGCDHPRPGDEPELAARGFWRVDKHEPPQLRHTVLAQVAFAELEELGVEAFLAQHEGEGWMIPDTLRLADYGLGHDADARRPQEVAGRLGPRIHDWQLREDVARSWERCERHAALLDAVLAPGPA